MTDRSQICLDILFAGAIVDLVLSLSALYISGVDQMH